ncbi:MAG: replication initiation protein [Leptospirales bacterium]
MMPLVVQASTEWRERFYELLPRKPYCSDDLGYGTVIRSKSAAIKKKYIQINDPAFVRCLVFDVDWEWGAWMWESAGLPVPGWTTINRENGHSHIVYPLKSPVCRTDAARVKPLRFLAGIEFSFGRMLEADPGYSGLLTKNPLHPFWGLNVFNSNAAFDLGTLADWIDLPSSHQNKNSKPAGLGRNCTLFEEVRHWAYRSIREYWGPSGAELWHIAVLNECRKRNVFSVPLSESEVRATAKSIASWTWKRMTPTGRTEMIQKTHTDKIQSNRGKRSGIKRKERSIVRWDSLISRSVPLCPIVSHNVPEG